MVEKASYTGPWQVPWKRAKKDPSAPKRPMSAFLYFSQGKRTVLKNKHPEMKNTEVSRLLGEMWRNASEEEREPHISKERSEREKYKVAIAEWRKDFEAKQQAQRSVHAEQLAIAMQGAEQAQQQPPMLYPDAYGQPPMAPQPYMYAGYAYPYPPNPYHFPTNGKQPVVLGPNGMPRYMTSYPPSDSVQEVSQPNSPQQVAHAPIQQPPFDEGAPEHFDYAADEAQAAG